MNYTETAMFELIRTSLFEGDPSIPPQVDWQAVYQEMKYYLLDEQRIFDYMPEGTESLSYGENTDMHTITFLIKQQQE